MDSGVAVSIAAYALLLVGAILVVVASVRLFPGASGGSGTDYTGPVGPAGDSGPPGNANPDLLTTPISFTPAAAVTDVSSDLFAANGKLLAIAGSAKLAQPLTAPAGVLTIGTIGTGFTGQDCDVPVFTDKGQFVWMTLQSTGDVELRNPLGVTIPAGTTLRFGSYGWAL